MTQSIIDQLKTIDIAHDYRERQLTIRVQALLFRLQESPVVQAGQRVV
jgi:hypothetical protein